VASSAYHEAVFVAEWQALLITRLFLLPSGKLCLSDYHFNLHCN